MKKYKEDAVLSGAGGFRIQGLINYTDADWSECQKINCPKFLECENDFINKAHISCINPLKDDKRVNIYEHAKSPELEGLYTKHNATGNYFLDAIVDHLVGDATPTLEIDHAYFTSRFDPPDADTTVAIDDHQVGSNVAITKDNVGRIITMTVNILSSSVNCLDTTIDDAVFTPTTTVFDLDLVTGLDTGGGDMIQINLGTSYGLQERKIVSISTKRVTIDKPLPIAPSDGDVVRQILTNMYICMADNTVISSSAYGLFKDSSISRQISLILRVLGS